MRLEHIAYALYKFVIIIITIAINICVIYYCYICNCSL